MAKITSNRTVTFTIELTEEEALTLHNFLAHPVMDNYVHSTVRDFYRALNTELYAQNSL